jgi:NAD(P)-dependent dehydrogenase (short-subunit alcohol dehydrogenase family)
VTEHSNENIVVVVTGAAMGMGEAISRRLVADDMHVIAVDVNAAALERVRAELGERYRPLVGDVGEWETHERAADAAEAVGPLRHWVNNAGIDVVGGAHEVTPADIAAGLRVCQLGVMYGCAIAVRRMLPQRFGTIVNISSIQGVAAWPRYFVYDSAKAAILMATKSVALDYAPFGIRANVVLPGNIDTPMLRASLPPDLSTEAGLEREAALAPMLRIGEPGEIAEVVAFLLSGRSSFVNGAEIIVDGGAMVRCFPHPVIDVPPAVV